MDKHYLTPLFSPSSIVVFAGDPSKPEAWTALARAVLDGLRGQGTAPGLPFAGPISYFDIQMTGTLADLAQAATRDAQRLLVNARRSLRRAQAKAAQLARAGVRDAAAGRRRQQRLCQAHKLSVVDTSTRQHHAGGGVVGGVELRQGICK